MFALALILMVAPALAERPLEIADALAIKDVTDPRVSPDGNEVAFVVASLDLDEDSGSSNIYLVPMSGGEAVALTSSDKANTHPRFSPDGRFIAFLSNRSGKNQVWRLNRAGGEPTQWTRLPGGASTFEWSPDASAVVVVSRDAEPEIESGQTPPPIVITRRQFKRDGRGYLDDRRTHLYVQGLDDDDARQVTRGNFDDAQPAWSPDGRELAFVSNRTDEPDANSNTDIFLIPAGGGEPRRLTTNPGADDSPSFSPDGRYIAYTTVVRPEIIWYATTHLGVIPADGGTATVLSSSLDRNVRSPRFSDDGLNILFLLEDSGNQHLASIPLAGGPVTRRVGGERDVRSYHNGVVLVSEPHLPPEVATESLVRLSHVNDELLSDIDLADVESLTVTSKDGTEVEAFVTKPPGFEDRAEGTLYPTILWIHGGPVSQYSTRFNAQWQVFAATGYVVVAVNPRGSSGYGEEYSRSIWADWGNRDFQDVMAAVDHLVQAGIADPERLGVGGWSYGGILTDFVITKTNRFKAAISGASETNFLACYGTDHYQLQWEMELGLPWENRELYTRLSPITHVANIETPTLVLSGEVDWNIPVSQSEQLYMSLRRRGIDTELIVYPGQSHGISKPSYQKDRYERYIAWFDRWLRGGDASSRPTAEP